MTTRYQRTVAAQRMELADRTPYDTGKRSEPKVWGKKHFEGPEDWGKVDFENDEGGTLATLYIEQDDDGTYAIRGDANEPLKVEIEMEGELLVIQPSDALRTKVQEVIDGLRTEVERVEAEVYWQPGKALILVPGETGYRKQQAIMVHEPGNPFAEVDSAIVKGWATGTRDTRV